MFAPFNEEMSSRLSDLWSAVVEGRDITFIEIPESDFASRHLRVSFGERKFALPVAYANAAAGQIEANGYPLVAERMRLAA